MVIADTQEHADQMARAVNVKYESSGKPILNIKEAVAAKSFYPASEDPVKIGNAEGETYTSLTMPVLTLLCY